MNTSQEINRGSPQDLPCVWMMADVLKYRLCDRNYDCEHCDLYRVMRGQPGQIQPSGDFISIGRQNSPSRYEVKDRELESQIDSYLSQLIAGSKLYLDRCYSPNHFWMYPNKDGTVSVGLDANILRLLTPVKEIIPPEPKIALRKNQLCGWLIRGEKTIPLHAPMHGKIVSVNSEYLESFYGAANVLTRDDWLFTMESQHEIQTVEDLCRGDEMLTWYACQIQTLKQYLRESMIESGVPELGVTLADGGETQTNLELLLGEAQFARFVSELFHTH